MKIIFQIISILKGYGAFIATSVIAIVLLILRRESSVIKEQKAQIKKQADDAAIAPLKADILTTQREVDLAEKDANDAEKKLRMALDIDPAIKQGPSN